MNQVEACKKEIIEYLEKIQDELMPLEDLYDTFFKIEEVFSSENGGKTRLNRQLFNENHEIIIKIIATIESLLDESLETIKVYIKKVLSEYNEFNKVDLVNLVFDDSNFIEILEIDLNNKVITSGNKKRLLSDIKNLLNLKNRVFNIKYYLEMFDTTIFDKLLNKLGIEDLINSGVIFEIIDSYGLQYEELQKFKYEINNFTREDDKVSSFQFLNSLLELHKRRVDNFIYANVRYKIFLDYNNDLDFRKSIHLNKSYLENIISNLIDQSCMDLIKKEMKKGKIQKTLDVIIEKSKGKFYLTIRNNGFEINNVYTLFVSDIDNKYILEAKNLSEMMGAKLEVQSVEGEGMVYTLIFK